MKNENCVRIFDKSLSHVNRKSDMNHEPGFSNNNNNNTKGEKERRKSEVRTRARVSKFNAIAMILELAVC